MQNEKITKSWQKAHISREVLNSMKTEGAFEENYAKTS